MPAPATPETVSVSLSLLAWLAAGGFAAASAAVACTLWIVKSVGKVGDKVTAVDRKFVGHAAKVNATMESHDDRIGRLERLQDVQLSTPARARA